MTKWQCLHCSHLDIELPNEAVCTGCYDPDAIKKSVMGHECPHQIKE